jgi:hypothetical protein
MSILRVLGSRKERRLSKAFRRWSPGALALVALLALLAVAAATSAAAPIDVRLGHATASATPATGQPFVNSVTPKNKATSIRRDAGVVAAVTFATAGDGIDASTLTAANVNLTVKATGALVPASLNSDAAGATISLQPSEPLAANTKYVFTVTAGLTTTSGQSFLPFSSVFTSGTEGGPCGTPSSPCPVQFDRVALPTATGHLFTSLAIGPDGMLYAGTLDGTIARWPILADGPLGAEQDLTALHPPGTDPTRTVMGIAFDPSSTASNLILWVTNDDATSVLHGGKAKDWTGKITRLSGPSLATATDYVVGLPRSISDHMTNSLAFGPDGALYVAQGANTAAGDSDPFWGGRLEDQLSAAILRLAPSWVAKSPGDPSLPLNAKTTDGIGGTYDPFAPGAPLTIYASGLRNPWDLVWASNGQLYAPVNGTAKGGNAPGTPATLPAACANRIDGPWSGPAVPALKNLPAEDDWFDRVIPGMYYGHPDPARCEWAMNGANPTASKDFGEVKQYPVGTQPDRNYAGSIVDSGGTRPIFDIGQHFSPDGAIQYHGQAFGTALDGWFMVARYSLGDDVMALDPAGANGDVSQTLTGIPGLDQFDNPLDLTEDTATGNLYVDELPTASANGVIWLERPVLQRVALSTGQVATNVVVGKSGAEPTVTVTNTGTRGLTIGSVSLDGSGAASFAASSEMPLPAVLAPGQSDVVDVTFTPAAAGPVGAVLHVASDDPQTPDATVQVRGLGTNGKFGSLEPSLQWILDTLQIPINAGDPDPTNPSFPGTSNLVGDEVAAQGFVKAASGPVTVTPIALFGPKDNAQPDVATAGWYGSGNPASAISLFSLPKTANQALDPATGSPPTPPTTSFDPGATRFGLWSSWPHFGHASYQEDPLNTWDPAHMHKLRVYPFREADGTPVANSYVVATEETTAPYDYNDLVVVITNVQPA